MEGALAPTVVYRLKGPGAEITYRFGTRTLTYDLAELGPDGSSLSGSSVVQGVEQPGIGTRLDAELSSTVNGKVLLTVLLSDMRWGGVAPTGANGAAIITHVVHILEADSYPLQRYSVVELQGSASWIGI